MRFLGVYCAVVLTWIALSVIGALGPHVNVVEEFGLKKCLVNRANDHITDHKLSMIDKNTCKDNGVIVEELELDKLKSIESYDVIFFVALPVKRFERKMSRLFQYLLADIDVSLRSQYVQKLKDHGHSQLEYHISLGYRNTNEGAWQRLASGNASRVLDCQINKWGTYSCDHFPLFELWSCHHEHYLINLRIPLLPLTDLHLKQFKGISAVKDMSLVEIHQHPDFTKVWFIAKLVFFVVSSLVLIFYKSRLQQHKSFLYLLYCLVFLNLPLELLTLYFDLPWMILLNDFRHGLMIGAICVFCTVFVAELECGESEQFSFSRYWWYLFLTFVSCVTFFVYEFCERGIQVFMPFYSIWGTHRGKYVCYSMIAIATLAALLFLISLIVKVIQVIIKLRRTVQQSSSQNAKERLVELYGFIALTVSVCVCGVLGYIIPAEAYLLHWIHSSRRLSLYGALLMSNYGLWNVYVFASTLLYSKFKSNMKLTDKSSH